MLMCSLPKEVLEYKNSYVSFYPMFFGTAWSSTDIVEGHYFELTSCIEHRNNNNKNNNNRPKIKIQMPRLKFCISKVKESCYLTLQSIRRQLTANFPKQRSFNGHHNVFSLPSFFHIQGQLE